MGPAFNEKHFAPREIADMWGLSYDKVLELFRHEPGVFVIGNEGQKRKRVYRTIRIPESVAQRVHRRMSRC